MRIRKYISSKKGFTLIEIIVVVALIGIVSTVLSRIFIFSNRTYSQSKNLFFSQTDNRLGSEIITDKLRYATELELINPSVNMEKGYEYIYFDKNNNYLIYRNMAGDEEKLTEGKINYDISNFNLENRILSFKISDESNKYDIVSDINLINIAENLEKQTDFKGVKYRNNIPTILDYFSTRNKFWRDIVGGWYENTITKSGQPEKYTNASKANTGDLYLTISGENATQNAAGASLILQKLTDDYFNKSENTGSEYSKNNYKITIDAQTQNLGGGYGVLINGAIKKDSNGTIKDYGYMFQFDPGANGFVIRQIYNGMHDSHTSDTDNTYYKVGIQSRSDGRKRIYNHSYFPEDLNNENFKMEDLKKTDWRYNNRSEQDKYKSPDWNKRYKTEIRVKVDKNKGLLLDVKLLDEKGNESNTIKFGDFGEYKLNGVTFKGKPLDWNYSKWEGINFPGEYIGIRSWNAGGETKHETKFYEMKLEAID